MDTLLRSLATNRDIQGWEQTAQSWLIAAVVIAITAALLMLLVKWLIKQRAAGPSRLGWSQGRTIAFILLGFLPIVVAVTATWYLSLDFHAVTGVPGLFKGVLVTWLIYTVLMLVAHGGIWRSDLY